MHSSGPESRRPRASPLWQLVRCIWDDFLAGFEAHHRPAMGPLRPDTITHVEDFLHCGDLAAGFTRFLCPGCGHQHLLAFTCKSRHFCPACHQRRTLQTGAWIAAAAAAAVHTFGDYLIFHPHLHLLAADGLFDKEGRFPCIPAPPKTTARAMRPLWRDLILSVWGADPLKCPSCHGTMKRVETIVRRGDVEKRRRLVGVLDRNLRSG